MENILINIENRNFGDSVITLAELLNLCEDLICENDELKEQIEDIIQDREDNYKRVSVAEQVGIYDIDFL